MRITLMSGLFLIGCTACKDKETANDLPDNAGDAVSTYVDIVVASYGDSVSTASALTSAVDAFVASPSDSGLDAARQAWLDSREPYLQTEVYRFYDGPIDNPDTGPEGLINAWPMDENHIDYVSDDASSGIVNDTSITIDAATLESLNEDGGETKIATGFHAIEFLLWGQDQSDSGPGDRPHTDFLTDDSATAENGDRRGEYLKVTSALLVTHLQSIETEWEGAYGTSFVSDDFTALQNILTGMIILSGFETGGERLQAALDSGDQEDEHSCFSDNTHRDMIQDVQGIANVWSGTYTRTDGSTVSGTGVRDVVAELDADLAARVDDRIDQSLSLANSLVVPFDNEIAASNAEGNERVAALIDSLREQEDVLFEVFSVLGMSVTIPAE
jgi:putative iron-regulated protein